MYPIVFDQDRVSLDYAKYCLLAEEFTAFASEASARARMPKLNREQLVAYDFPLPPLAEQERIAAGLTASLAAVDRARRAAADRLAAAEALPAAYLREVFEGPEADTRRLDEIADLTLGKMASPKSRTGSNSYVYLRNANVQWGRFELHHLLKMDFDEDERRKFSLRPGDLMVCEGGEPGRAAVWEGQIEDCYFQKALFRIRSSPGIADSRFLMYRLWFGAAQCEFIDGNATTTIAHLPRVRLAALELPVPPLAAQQRIADDLSTKLAAADALIARCREEMAAVGALPAALLRAAFGTMA